MRKKLPKELSYEGLVVGSKEYNNVKSRRWRFLNPEKWKASQEKHIKNRDRETYLEMRKRSHRKCDYSMTHEDFLKRVKAQNGRCAICRKETNKFHVDHDHSCCPYKRRSCGKCTRGLLCHACNTFIGSACESEKILENAIQYLRKHKRNSNG